MTGHHTDAPWSALGPVTLGPLLLWSCHQQPLEQSCRPLTGARPRGPCGATESPHKVQHVSRLDSLYLLISHSQTQAAPWRKGRGKLPGRKAGLVARGTSHRETVLGVSRHLTWWPQLAPRCLGDAFLEAVSAQDFIAGEPHRPTYSWDDGTNKTGPGEQLAEMKLDHVNCTDCHAALLAFSPRAGSLGGCCPSRWNKDKRGTTIRTGTPTSTAA